MPDQANENYVFEEWEKNLLRFDGQGNVWSVYEDKWVTPEQYAREKHRRRRHRAIYGTNEELQAQNNYERHHGI
jgi:hypothetical protein